MCRCYGEHQAAILHGLHRKMAGDRRGTDLVLDCLQIPCKRFSRRDSRSTYTIRIAVEWMLLQLGEHKLLVMQASGRHNV